MTLTAREIITRALRRVRVKATGQTPSADEAQDMLDLLNELIDEWNNEQLMLPVEVGQDFTLVPSTSTYTLGSGGTFNYAAAPPTEIRYAKCKRTSGDLWEFVDVLTKDRYQREPDLVATADIPNRLFYQDTLPLGTVIVLPVPTTAGTLKLFMEQQLTQFTALDTQIVFQQGFAAALRLNLAMKAAGEFGWEPDELLVPEATEAKARIKRRNEEAPELIVDTAYQPYGGFDISVD